MNEKYSTVKFFTSWQVGFGCFSLIVFYEESIRTNVQLNFTILILFTYLFFQLLPDLIFKLLIDIRWWEILFPLFFELEKCFTKSILQYPHILDIMDVHTRLHFFSFLEKFWKMRIVKLWEQIFCTNKYNFQICIFNVGKLSTVLFWCLHNVICVKDFQLWMVFLF